MNQLGNQSYPADAGEMDIIRGLNAYIAKVYGWMFIGLALTALTAFAFVADEARVIAFVTNPILFYGCLIGELVLVFVVSRSVMKLPFSAAAGLFALYAVLNGLTLSVILLVYTGASLSLTFFVTAGMFGVMSVYGRVTRTDLSRFRGILTMGLIGVVVLSLINMLLRNTALDWVVSLVGLFVFLGLTAYDMQKIRTYYFASEGNTLTLNRLGLLGALSLYLDFINLFLMLLRLFGRRRN